MPQFPLSLGRALLLFPEDTLHLGMYGQGPVGRHILPAAGGTQHTALFLTSLSQNLVLLSSLSAEHLWIYKSGQTDIKHALRVPRSIHRVPAGHVAGLGGKGLNYNQHRKNLRKEEEFFQRILTVLMHRFLSAMEKLHPLYSPNPSNTFPFYCKCWYQRKKTLLSRRNHGADWPR